MTTVLLITAILLSFLLLYFRRAQLPGYDQAALLAQFSEMEAALDANDREYRKEQRALRRLTKELEPPQIRDAKSKPHQTERPQAGSTQPHSIPKKPRQPRQKPKDIAASTAPAMPPAAPQNSIPPRQPFKIHTFAKAAWQSLTSHLRSTVRQFLSWPRALTNFFTRRPPQKSLAETTAPENPA